MTLPRYPAYKDSGVEWLGEVPEHWRMERLKRVCSVFPSNVDKKIYDGDPTVSLCNYTDVYYNDLIVEGMPLMEATATVEQIQRFTLQTDDTIITKDSETADDIGVSAYVPQTLPGVVCGYHLSMVRPMGDTSGRFIKRFFDSRFAKAQMQVAANGLTRVGLSQSALDNLLVPYPSVHEQTAIAAFLDHETAKIDALIGEQRNLIELLKEKRQAVISHAVTKGLNPDAPMKDSGVEWLGEVPEHWEIARLGALFFQAQDAGTENLPVLSVSIHHGVSDRELDEDEMDRKVTRIEDRTKYRTVRAGDLVYNMMRAWQGGFGTVYVDGLVSPAYVVARPKGHVETSYVEKVLRTPAAVEEMRRHSQGVTDFRLRLYWEEFKTIQLPLPPEQEQGQILEAIQGWIDQSDSLTAEAEHAIGLLQERRTALISAAVTGKTDVRSRVAQNAA